MRYPSTRALTVRTDEERLLQMIKGVFSGTPTHYSVFESNNIRLRNEGFRTFLILDSIPKKVEEALKSNRNYWVAPSYRELGKIEITKLD